MNRRELVAQVAAEVGVSQFVAGEALDAALGAIVAEVAAGRSVALAGFGTFEPRDRAAREGRHPRTGEPMAIAASRVPAFKAAAGFRAAVNDRV